MIDVDAYMAWLRQTPDASGECDRCHCDNVALWSLPDALDRDSGGEAGWMYCRHCFRKAVKAAKGGVS